MIMKEIIIQFNEDGTADAIYTEAINLEEIGQQHIKRASHVEPTENGLWTADMSPIEAGVILGPFEKRSEALEAEQIWLNKRLFCA